MVYYIVMPFSTASEFGRKEEAVNLYLTHKVADIQHRLNTYTGSGFGLKIPKVAIDISLESPG